jgi:hypothetical protein
LLGCDVLAADGLNLEAANMECVGDITDRPSKAVVAVLPCAVIRSAAETCERARMRNTDNEGSEQRQIQRETIIRSLRRDDSWS